MKRYAACQTGPIVCKDNNVVDMDSPTVINGSNNSNSNSNLYSGHYKLYCTGKRRNIKHAMIVRQYMYITDKYISCITV